MKENFVDVKEKIQIQKNENTEEENIFQEAVVLKTKEEITMNEVDHSPQKVTQNEEELEDQNQKARIKKKVRTITIYIK